MRQVMIYVAGPLSGTQPEYVSNMHRMIRAANILRREGYSVFVPGLDFLCGLLDGDWKYENYFNNNQAWLEAADCIYRMPGDSSGADREVALAQELGIPVFDTIEEIKAAWPVKKEENDL